MLSVRKKIHVLKINILLQTKINIFAVVFFLIPLTTQSLSHLSFSTSQASLQPYHGQQQFKSISISNAELSSEYKSPVVTSRLSTALAGLLREGLNDSVCSGVDMPPLKSDTCRIKNGEKFFNQTDFTNTSRIMRQLYGVLQHFILFFLNFMCLTFWRCYLLGLESKQLWRCAINHSKKIIALEVFQTRNMLNFGCSLNFWKTLHIQVMYALSEGTLLFHAVLSGSQ